MAHTISLGVSLDAAPGPLHPLAKQTLLAAIESGWADPRRLHRDARKARAMLDQARLVIASGLGVRAEEVTFHAGGAIGALSAAVDGLLHAHRRRGERWVASAVEHSALLLPGRYAAAQAGDPERFAEVPVDRLGRVDLDRFAAEVARPGTAFAALQHANGEVGTVQPTQEAYAACSAHGIPLLIDATASAGRVPVPADYDVLVADASTAGGPPLGILIVPERTRFARSGAPREFESGRADSPVWAPLALAAAEAWQQSAAVAEEDAAAASALIAQLRQAAGAIPDVEVVGDPDRRLPHVMTCSALYADGEAIVLELDRRRLSVASGSACTASALEPSHVLTAMGVLTHGNIRVTLPLAAVAPLREQAVDALRSQLPEAIAEVRAQLGAREL